MKTSASKITAALTILVMLAAPAHAYTGPGLGLATITVALGFIASIFVAIFAIVWYPIKRMMKRKKSASNATSSNGDSEQTPDG